MPTTAPTVQQPKTLTLAAGQTTFDVVLTVPRTTPYAGCEFAVQMGESVQISTVSYEPAPSRTTSPTAARGLVWFSYYAGANDYRSLVTVTLHCTYTAPANAPRNTSLVLDRASFYTISGKGLKTDQENLRQVTTIQVAGADNAVAELVAPASHATPAGVTAPPSAGSSGTQSGSAAARSAAKSAAPPAEGAPNASAGQSPTVFGEDAAAGRSENASADATDIVASTVATQRGQSPISASRFALSGVVWLLLATALAAAIVLGWLLIRERRKTHQTEQDTTKRKDVP